MDDEQFVYIKSSRFYYQAGQLTRAAFAKLYDHLSGELSKRRGFESFNTLEPLFQSCMALHTGAYDASDFGPKNPQVAAKRQKTIAEETLKLYKQLAAKTKEFEIEVDNLTVPGPVGGEIPISEIESTVDLLIDAGNKAYAAAGQSHSGSMSK